MKKLIHICTRVVPITLMMVLTFTACKKRPAFQTVLPNRAGGVSEEGPTSQGNRSGNTGGIGQGLPLGPGSGLNPGGSGLSSTPITIPSDGVGNPDDTLRGGFDSAIPDESKFAAETVYFDFDKAVVNESEVAKIKTVAQHYRSNPSHLLEIQGHCDERGTEEYNRSLGERRAQAIREFLVREGVDSNKMRTMSFGEDRPAEQGHNEAAWSKNRRGVFILLTPK